MYSKPPKYRFEHRRPDLAPLVLGFADAREELPEKMREFFDRLMTERSDGVLVAIDQQSDPERTVTIRDVPAPGTTDFAAFEAEHEPAAGEASGLEGK